MRLISSYAANDINVDNRISVCDKWLACACLLWIDSVSAPGGIESLDNDTVQ